MLKRLLAMMLLAGVAQAGTIAGSLQTPTAGAVKNGTLTFDLSQATIVSGTASIVPSTSACYTSTAGAVVGIPDPIVLPVLATNTGSGSLAAGTYYVKITYVGAGGESYPSAESVINLVSQGTVIVSAPALQPASATGYKVYISSATGTETLQGTVTGFTNYSQSSALVSGAALPSSNSSVCTIYFSDQMIPTGTYYSVNLKNRNGTQMAGYPQTWCTYGGSGGTINVSGGAPTGNCGAAGVYYPTPLLTAPALNALQSISGPLSLGTYSFTAGDITGGNSNLKSVNGILNAARCSGADIGAKANDCASTLGAGGGEIYIPKGSYNFSTPFNFDDTTDITLICAGGVSAGGTPSTTLTYTGTGVPFSTKSTKGMIISGCQIRWSNAAFTGPVIDLSHSAMATDSFGFNIIGNAFVATGSGVRLDRIIDLDKVHTGKVEGNFLYDYKQGIRGASGSGSYSNNIRIIGNHFDRAETVHIANPQDTWLIESNTFEMSTSAGDPKVISVAAGVAPRNISVLHNWIGDTGVGATATRIDASEGYNWDVSDNTIGGLQATTTAISFGSNVIGARAVNNFLTGHLVGVAFGSTVTAANVVNQYQSVTTPISGTPSSSYEQGANNELTIRSSAQINLAGNVVGVGDVTFTPSTRARIVGLLESTLYGTVTNCLSTAAPAVCVAAPAGSVVVAAAATTVTVNTTAVTANSQIFLQNDSSLGTRLSATCNTQSSLVLGTPRVTARVASTSFTITLEVAPTADPMCISYEIVN